MMDYEAVIGLEIHVELNCPTKMFCDCPNHPGDEANKNTCPICLWLPGAIPRFGYAALGKAVLACLALNCEIQEQSSFDQKVYYYPDQPKGFQLSQAHHPLARNGRLSIIGEDGQPRVLRIHHIHMEEDVAKLVHEMEGKTPISLVDFNRAGVPLIEIVTEPDIRSAHDAMEFVRLLRTQIRYVESSECNLESGTMRVDANISVRPRGTEQMNTKVEVKNMNSIRHVGDAIAYEIERQKESLAAGAPIVPHTRLWDPVKKVTTVMRDKLPSPCVPDPSVPPIVISREWLEEQMTRLPEMPGAKAERFHRQFDLTGEEAFRLCGEKETADYFEQVMGMGCRLPPRMVNHWLMAQLIPSLREQGETLLSSRLTPSRFSELLNLIDRDEINLHSAKAVLIRLLDTDLPVRTVIEQGGFSQVSDASELEEIVADVLKKHAAAVADYRGGNAKTLGFLIGQAMKDSGGKANPKVVRELLIKALTL
ncbi:MAG: Asp-tRNA(Asn)/Glu-tRNA(Gln) amidotransferase subunit GatB [Syntrophales bacterium]|jgi:aspartyl-tRNA(Asn)/glutamyl-tRNA(Gln) amidotransferase subunit B|nr:Asp-tRNA(Asn)/Glu-tRNA(Gln) amidotransferase subunit GatB [Syntrophales bacterium]